MIRYFYFLFSFYGTQLTCNDKSTDIHRIEKTFEKQNTRKLPNILTNLDKYRSILVIYFLET